MTTLALGKTTLISSYLFLCIACGGSTKVSDKDEFFIPATKGTVTDNAFDPERLLQVSIQLPTADYEVLKEEGRTLDQALSACPSQDFEYTDFVAKVNIDGQTLENVAIRKKGYLGSLSRFRPSLKLNFDTHEEGRTFKTLKRMTLNNNRQDPSFARQCLAYDLFSKAGIIAPRCNLAQVYVNGEDLGVYSHIESIKKPFLERTFINKSGNLYEAQVADLGTHLKDKFELKTNKTLNDRSDLAAFSSVLDETDDNFINELKKYVDLDEFITYWAVESMIGHWDSATGNANNFYMYKNPDDNLFHFIPWGTDAAFTGENIFKPKSGPLYQNFSLAARLYAIEESRDLYHSKLLDLLGSYWVEADLIASIDKVSSLTQAQAGASNHLKEFIKGNSEKSSQQTTLTTAIANQAADQIKYLLKDEALDCTTPVTQMTLTASFSSGSPADFGTFQFRDRDGAAHIANINYATVGPKGVDSLVYLHNTSTLPSTHELTAVGVTLKPGTISLDKAYSLQIMLEDSQYTPGEYSLHGISNNVMLFEVLSEEGDVGHPILDTIAVGHSGNITLEKAGDGSVAGNIKGSISATMTIMPKVE
jgi:hypothetical protein